VEDGYRMFPIELSGYFIIPVSTEKFKLYIGGGGGVYWGERIRNFSIASSEPVNRPLNFGIHVLSGLEYFVREQFSIRGEMKFRDPQFDTESQYTTDRITVNGLTYALSTQPFKSKVNLDGIVFQLQVAFHF
jgi:hypothetical protein